MPIMMKLLKVIDGKLYDLVGSEFSEKKAKRKADAYRSMGYSARVIEFDKDTQIAVFDRKTIMGKRRAGRKIFAVYVSHEKRRGR